MADDRTGQETHVGRTNASGEQVHLTKQAENPPLAFFLQMLDGHTAARSEQLHTITTDLVTHLDDLVGLLIWT